MGIKGSHNTFTYLVPKQWYLIPFYWMGRCQSKDYIQQEADAYDVRIFFDGDEIVFRHGFFSYDASEFWRFVQYCDDNSKHVRILLENRSYLNIMVEVFNMRERFAELCRDLEKYYPNVKFYGGRDLYNGDTLFRFKNNIKEEGYYSSVKNKFLSFFPWLYARIYNKVNMKKIGDFNDKTVVYYDFL